MNYAFASFGLALEVKGSADFAVILMKIFTLGAETLNSSGSIPVLGFAGGG